MPGRKHVTLSLQDKHEVIKLIDGGVSYPKIASRFGIGKATVADIKKKRQEILEFISRTERGTGKRKTLKKAANPVVDNALFSWFIQQRRLNVPISGELITEKAQFFYEKITNRKDFNASRGWLDKFKKRHSIRQLKLPDVNSFNDDVTALDAFRQKLRRVIEEKQLAPQQIYNVDESSLLWRLRPNTTPSTDETSIFNDRITFMPCANASGEHKLRLLVVGEVNTSHSLSSINLPVFYRRRKNAWIDKQIFSEWFKYEFVPSVRQHLLEKNLEQQALLLLDSAPDHPAEEQLRSEDGKIFAVILPSNCASSIQPMNQNVIQDVKLRFRKKLLTHVIAQQDTNNDDVTSILKKIDMKEVAFDLADCWDNVSQNLIKQSWAQLLPELCPVVFPECELEDNIPLSLLVNRITSGENINEETIQEWAKGGAEAQLTSREHLTDEEIISIEMKGNEVEEDRTKPNVPTVTNAEAFSAFTKCIQWAEENGVTTQDALMLRRLRDQVSVQITLRLQQRTGVDCNNE